MPDSDRIIRIGNKTYHLRKRHDGAGMQLVRAQPDDVLPDDTQVERKRTQAVEAYGNYRPAPRAQVLENIDQAVEKRTQTILSHEVDPDVRAALNGQLVSPPNRGRR